ncbi:relaxase/mobilization nuclease domain-containing protein [Hydrogenophaga sp.]|uniref:relaxase/mobilization nuclease domain-containing protein n=1 Tax=Hydrogenophaga sp. TaxID=1904254 RepID=UPI00286DC36F|nr:relaxase/mobilization nuclease domain-containing protein [Hydrogenophaga sp.]
MTTGASIDGVLVQWGERLFYPASRIVKPDTTPRLNSPNRSSAAVIRQRIAATVARRAPQVMVKVTGGGRGMGAIAAHLRYICKNGQLRMEDERGVVREGKEAMHDLAEQWRVSGSLIPQTSHRREAFNIMLSMPKGTDAQTVLKAARAFAKHELKDHHYVMVLHEHQANPHVHLSVKAESIEGKRLNPRKTDLHRWRETFAEQLRGYGVEAEATRQASRGVNRRDERIWESKVRQEGRLDLRGEQRAKSGATYERSHFGAFQAWANITKALQASDVPEDRELAKHILRFISESAYFKEVWPRDQREAARQDKQRPAPVQSREVLKAAPSIDMER